MLTQSQVLRHLAVEQREFLPTLNQAPAPYCINLMHIARQKEFALEKMSENQNPHLPTPPPLLVSTHLLGPSCKSLGP